MVTPGYNQCVYPCSARHCSHQKTSKAASRTGLARSLHDSGTGILVLTNLGLEAIMTGAAQNRRFSGRALISMPTTGGFLIMGVTGLMLFATPEGRLAYLSRLVDGRSHQDGMGRHPRNLQPAVPGRLLRPPVIQLVAVRRLSPPPVPTVVFSINWPIRNWNFPLMFRPLG